MNECKEYMSQTEIGGLYGVSSHKVGKWLKSVGLRTESGSPSREAFDEGYVARRESRQPGIYFYVWDADKTIRLLDAMEYPRCEKSPHGC